MQFTNFVFYDKPNTTVPDGQHGKSFDFFLEFAEISVKFEFAESYILMLANLVKIFVMKD